MNTLEFHPAANLFPLLNEQELSELADSIRQNGQRDPIVIHPDGRILDGRNRFLACQKLNIKVKTVNYTGMGDMSDAIKFVVDTNLVRRHLNSSQRAMIAAKSEDILHAERNSARERMEAGTPSEIIRKGRATEQVASQFKTNARYIEKAEKLIEQAPDLAEQIEAGILTIPQAERQVKEQHRQEKRESDAERIRHSNAPTKLKGVFTTVVIDPPWDWGDEGDVNQMGRAKPDYATTPSFCTQPFIDTDKDNACGECQSVECIVLQKMQSVADDAHIYLWITNRSLPKGFDLLESWGFRYITALTWCKPHYGMGNYFRGSTEHLLFGVKGSLSLKRKNAGTWFQAPRGEQHSAKPNAAYELIESCSPGPYLDLFGRQEREGWTVWG